MNHQKHLHHIKDPVCGMRIDSEIAENDSIWKGKSYFFCAENCKVAFEKSPEKYLKKKSWLQRIWDGYLYRLNKQTSGKTPCCH